MHTYVDSIVGKRAVFGFFSTTSANKIDKKHFISLSSWRNSHTSIVILSHTTPHKIHPCIIQTTLCASAPVDYYDIGLEPGRITRSQFVGRHGRCMHAMDENVQGTCSPIVHISQYGNTISIQHKIVYNSLGLWDWQQFKCLCSPRLTREPLLYAKVNKISWYSTDNRCRESRPYNEEPFYSWFLLL